MRLDRLTAADFRNLRAVTLVPDPELTVLCGSNGQGKTNLLEAVWLLTGGKSFRTGRDIELIRRGAEFAVLEGSFEAGGRAQKLRLTVGGRETQYPGRTVSLNDGPRTRAAAVAGTFSAVVFDPDHLRLVKDGPDGRRRFLDAALCQCWPAHLNQLRRFNRVLAQKNALLKSYDLTPDGALLLETFNAALAETGGAVMERRAQLVERLAPLASAYYDEISAGRESMSLRYLPCVPFGAGGAAAALAEKLRAMRDTELRAGFSLAGPHREDLEITINGEPGRTYGSQGQQRSAVLAMKLAEADVLGSILEEDPVMLLDDVLSELDDARQTYLLTHISGKQTVVTTCDSAAFGRTNGKIVQIKDGDIL